MNYLPLAIAAALFAMPAVADTTPAAGCGQGTHNAVLSDSGLGDDGFACTFQPFRPASAWVRTWVITGANPGSVITIEFDQSPILGPNPAGSRREGICSAFPAKTADNYAWGYPVPHWPDVKMEASYNTAHNSATITISSKDPLNPALLPESNYSLNVNCAVREY